MGKVKRSLSTNPNFTPLQSKIFSQAVLTPFILKQFYFTGGTALSAFYLNHRRSEDLDFFSEVEFPEDGVLEFMDNLAQVLGLTPRFTNRERTKIFEFVKSGNLLIKVDFAYYPHKRLELGNTYKGFNIDSIRDIATNKLLTINQRTEIKDYVDLYFLLKEFTLWDLIYAIERKFRMEMDLILIAADFLKVLDMDTMPEMIKPLMLDELKSFFREKAKELGRKSVE